MAVSVQPGVRQATARPVFGEVVVASLLSGAGLILASASLTSDLDASDLTRSLVVAILSMVLTGAGALLATRHLVRSMGGPLYARLGPAFACYFTLAFGVFALGWLGPEPALGSRRVIDPAQIPPAVALMAVALAAWTVGYCFCVPRGVVALAGRSMRSVFPAGPWCLRFPTLPLFLYAAGLTARGIRLRSGRFGYLQDASVSLAAPSSQNQLLAMLEDLCTYGLLLAALDAFVLSRSLRSKVILAVLIVTEAMLGMFAGSKEAVILTVATVALVYLFGRGAFPYYAKALVVFVVLIVFPLNQDYREGLRNDAPGSVGARTALGQLQRVLSETSTSLTPRAVLIDAPQRLALRLREVDNVALVRQKTPAVIPYAPWEELVYGPPAGVVPRAIWADKPVLSRGRDFAQDYYELPDTLYSASAVTVPGDLYRHGGMVPLVFGMALVGLLGRLVDVVADPRRDLRLLVVYVPAFVTLIKSESDFTVLMVGLLQTLLLAVLVGWMAFARRSS